MHLNYKLLQNKRDMVTNRIPELQGMPHAYAHMVSINWTS